MAPATGTALLVLGAFVLPGFVTLLLRERTYTVRGEETPFDRLLTALAYSAVVYALLVFWAWFFGEGVDGKDLAQFWHGEKNLGDYLLVSSLALFALPALITQAGLLWRRSRARRPTLLRRLGISPAHSTPSAWDHFFLTGQVALIRATLSDGRVVGGYYGDESFAGYTGQTQDLFLERRWELDDDAWFQEEAGSSLGVWLAHDSIVSLEIYAAPPRTNDARSSEA